MAAGACKEDGGHYSDENDKRQHAARALASVNAQPVHGHNLTDGNAYVGQRVCKVQVHKALVIVPRQHATLNTVTQ